MKKSEMKEYKFMIFLMNLSVAHTLNKVPLLLFKTIKSLFKGKI